MTPGVNCEADVKYPNKTQKGLCEFCEGKFLKIARDRGTKYNSRHDQSTLPLIRVPGWPAVRELPDFETLNMVFKSLNGDAPSHVSDMFTRVSETTSFSSIMVKQLQYRLYYTVPSIVKKGIKSPGLHNGWHLQVKLIFDTKNKEQNRKTRTQYAKTATKQLSQGRLLVKEF